MLRVAVVGNAGGGKSSLARAIANRSGLPFHAVDHLQWAPGWRPVPESDVTAAIDALIEQPSWVIDGWGPWATLVRRLTAADTIVLVDHPLWVHFWWAAERQIACARGEAPDGPEGCDMLEATERLFKMIWDVDQKVMPKLRTLIDTLETGRKVYRITSPEQLNAFIAAL